MSKVCFFQRPDFEKLKEPMNAINWTGEHRDSSIGEGLHFLSIKDAKTVCNQSKRKKLVRNRALHLSNNFRSGDQ